MSNRTPSLLALLGLAAIAGYQHRDKIGSVITDVRTRQQANGAATDRPRGGDFLSEVGSIFTGNNAGMALSDAVGGLMRLLSGDTGGSAADSWVASGPNKPMSRDELRDRLGAPLLSDLARRTGLAEEVIVDRLAEALPDMIDRLTPEGRLPSAADAAYLI
ncbi:YidB family protein [Frigidibacter sp. SD6-1]|uniref:YidB family protein n=1 Tax=Frigidibacter sp. SD6-1 TaxID=3032581 RepID=UPI0024DF7F4F|nr:YidB family protein [Frigidibacter sp. SD6-1]